MSLPNIPIYQIKIILKDIRPQVWRRVQVPADIRLNKLHRVFQAAMGWPRIHFHYFTIGEREFTSPFAKPPPEGVHIENERTVRLSALVTEAKTRFYYTYEFGDEWRLVATVEKVLAPFPNTQYPLCMGGKRATPPEDCGVVGGYHKVLKILATPLHPKHEMIRNWADGYFDPEAFELETVNTKLRQLRV